MRSTVLCLALIACGHSAASIPDSHPGADATGNDASGGDAGTCGGETCRGDQTCTGGSCEFASTGAQVPGDSATIAGAVGALGGQANAVICLAPQAYDEGDLELSGVSLSLVGASADRTTITTAHPVLTYGNVTTRGVSFSSQVIVEGGGGVLTAVGTRFQQGLEVERYRIAVEDASASAILDGCDVAGSIQLVDGATFAASGNLALELRNSYIHDSDGYCVSAGLDASSANLSITATGNTITRCDIGIYVQITALDVATTMVVLSLFNNIIAHNTTTGLALDTADALSDSTVNTGHNALWGNGANFSGNAVEGPGDVKQDCLLDGSTPPALGAGSPCLAAGDPANSSPHDFWNLPRGTPPDVGAVESP